MGQILFWIPIKTQWTPDGVPVYGFGLMLFLAFVIGSWLAGRRGRLADIPADKFQDLLVWVFLAGLVGGRVLYIVAETKGEWDKFFQIWNGGLVFYGGAIGGTIGAVVAYRRIMKPLGVSVWKLADAIAPAAAIGLGLGRLGCYLNACCWGYCAPPSVPAAHFPAMTAPARDPLVRIHGLQTLAGFAMDDDPRVDDRTIGYIEPDSDAERQGLKPGMVVVAVNGKQVKDYAELVRAFEYWPRGQTTLPLTLSVDGTEREVTLRPVLIGLYPTQLYEAISAFLICVALIATWPHRKYDGQLIVLLMLAYAVHRFVCEQLRDDTPPYLGLTLSQWISIGIFACGLVLGLIRRRVARATTTG